MAWGPEQRLRVRVQRVWKGRKEQARICRALRFPDFQGDAGVELLIDDLGEDNVAFERDRFTESAQNSQRVSVRSPIGAPDDRCVENVLAEKRGAVWAVVGEFGFVPGL